MVKIGSEVNQSAELLRERTHGRKEPMVNCPKCDAVIDVDEEELDEGDALICEECGANLSVSGVSPLELSQDADDDDEEEDEDLDDEDIDDDDEEVDEDEDEEEDEWK
jgi:alpha-aminoadipate carrier protein LysW